MLKVILFGISVVLIIVCATSCWAFGSVKNWKYRLAALVCLALCALFIFAAFELSAPFSYKVLSLITTAFNFG